MKKKLIGAFLSLLFMCSLVSPVMASSLEVDKNFSRTSDSDISINDDVCKEEIYRYLFEGIL